jgi:hypothetical protein
MDGRLPWWGIFTYLLGYTFLPLIIALGEEIVVVVS